MDESATAGHAPPELKTKLDQLDVTLHDLERVRQRREDTVQRFSLTPRATAAACCGRLVRLDHQDTASVAALNAKLTGLVDDSSQLVERVLQRVHAARRGKIRPVKDYLAR